MNGSHYLRSFTRVLVLLLYAAPVVRAMEQPTSAPAVPAGSATLPPAETSTVTQGRRGRFGAPERGVYKARITPHWFQNDTRFWYRNDLKGNTKEFILVDAEKGTRQPAFDHEELG